MKTIKYALLILVVGLAAVSCTEENVYRRTNEGDPIVIPPPPIKP